MFLAPSNERIFDMSDCLYNGPVPCLEPPRCRGLCRKHYADARDAVEVKKITTWPALEALGVAAPATNGGRNTISQSREWLRSLVGAAPKHNKQPNSKPYPATRQRPSSNIPDRILDQIKSGAHTSTDINKETGISMSAIHRAFPVLMSKGLILKTGGGNQTRYFPAINQKADDGTLNLSHQQEIDDLKQSHSDMKQTIDYIFNLVTKDGLELMIKDLVNSAVEEYTGSKQEKS